VLALQPLGELDDQPGDVVERERGGGGDGGVVDDRILEA
jgi:hypothetical protein